MIQFFTHMLRTIVSDYQVMEVTPELLWVVDDRGSAGILEVTPTTIQGKDLNIDVYFLPPEKFSKKNLEKAICLMQSWNSTDRGAQS